MYEFFGKSFLQNPLTLAVYRCKLILSTKVDYRRKTDG